MLTQYLKKIFQIANRGDATEQSYYSALEWLLKEYANSNNKKNVEVTTIPRKTEGGKPDFRIWDGKHHKVGYVEAKAPTVTDLDEVENTEQLKRYRLPFHNLILTNFFEFRHYRDGIIIQKVQICDPSILHKPKVAPVVEKEADFYSLLDRFFSVSFPMVLDAKMLAIQLAKRTRYLRDDVIALELKSGKSSITGFYEAFKKYLISGLTQEEFADLYSQTITYGLFAARTRSSNGFNRKLAYDNIPPTIGILRDVFRYISLGDPPEEMQWILDDISEILAVTDVKNILHQFFHEGKGKDPIVHFYETFLAEYDPETRERRGVYYTPEPVVSYIVRSLHKILKEEFNRPDGFAESSVTVLDPAAGTLTFLAEASKLAVNEYESKYGEGGKEKLIKEHILKNFYAFELMMAPYAVGHLKMGFLLEELGYKLKKDDRFQLYLTNTLEMEELTQTVLPGMASLSEESRLAGKVKKQTPILVILGNPPYSGISANLSEKEISVKKGHKYITHYDFQMDGDTGRYKLIPRQKVAKKNITVKQKTWIGELIEYYKIVDGKWFGERKHWLQDDYVKFIRFAQWKIDQAGEGVIGLITNHAYLDNPTFRGMRQSLMNSFNEIYVLDLHGNSLKKERCPDGSDDKNVFDIQQGVAIALFIKRKGKKKGTEISHSEIWGLREEKYDWLETNHFGKTKWQRLAPTSPFYFFVPREEKGREAFDKYWKITEIFPVNSTGVVTARDKFVIDFDRETLKRRIAMFRNQSMADEIIKQTYKLNDTRGWKFSKARKELAKDENWDTYFSPILYRPFDIRHIYYTQKMIDWPRLEVMQHMLQNNLGIHTCRQISLPTWQHVLATNCITDDCYVSNNTRERGYLFPLYLYPDADKGDLFSPIKRSEKRKPNIKGEILKSLTNAFQKELTPEEIFYYVYAVLYSNTYRTKYAEFLKIDFPRIPFTNNYELFTKMGGYGKQLVDLHLLRADLQLVAKFPVKGDAEVEKLRYDENQNRVYINKDQYFEGIPKEVWEYQIGGYQVSEKWLKDRKGRTLSLEDIKHYCKIITSLQKTIEIQKKIDETYPKLEKETVELVK